MSKRLIAIGVAAVAALAVIVVLGTGAGDDHSGDYKVRAIFSNAFTVIPGEDVKISGVRVGKIDRLDVTPDFQAAVILDITEPGFKDFRKDASCTIRPQSLIGERYVECTPTQPRAPGQAEAPELPKIKKGDGKGQYLLPSSNTVKPIDLDLVGNIMRLPYRERLSVIVNELGTGLAANGDALRRAVKQADPALEQTDKVLAILADQNKTLAELAENGDKVLAPLARDKAKVADFVAKADTTAQASAERRSDIEANLEKLPGFLQQLKPTMQRLGGLSDQLTPVLTDLGAAAPQINTFIEQLGPLAKAGTPALTSLGDTADVADQALLKSKPVVGDLKSFAADAKPTVDNLDKLLTSLKDTGGIERLMDLFYFSASSTNGYDSLGHYLRAIFVLTPCTTYVTKPVGGCSANFLKPVDANAATATAAGHTVPTVASVNQEIADGRSPFLARQDAVANGLDPAAFDAQSGQDAATADTKGTKKSSKAKATPKNAKIDLPASLFPSSPAAPAPASTPSAPSAAAGSGTSSSAAATPPAASGAPASSSAPSTSSAAPSSTSSAAPSTTAQPSSPSDSATTTLLDYLLGG
ncbi:MAG TPA: MlaD family protein [Baekduia sp.]|jgi:ABC-type transporter Mla subunit MlaD